MEEWRSRESNDRVNIDEADTKVEIDMLAQGGLLKEGDIPGTDLFDDGLHVVNGKEQLKPSSTIGGGAGMYLEDTGPLDMVS